MKSSQQAKYQIDGKNVYGFLFGHDIKLADGRKVPHLFQVEAFSKDHAWKRLQENRPGIPAREMYFVDYLEPEHDVGYLGEKLPMFPYGHVGSQKLQ